MNKKELIKSVCVVFFASFLLSSCGGRPTTYQADKDISPLSCVVLLPVEIRKDESSASGKLDNLEAGSEFLDKTIREQIGKSKVERVVESSQIHPQISEVSGGKLGTIREIGTRANCNSVLMTTLTSFRQRQGGELAVDAPASAAFDMQLIDADSGSNIWGSSFNETQTSLLKNIFSFGKAKSRGFKWITVEDLTAQGVKEKLQECPYFF